jgi:hypothetical protein
MGTSNTPSYVPLLKAKQAEWQALKDAPESVKDRIAPLIEVPPAPRDRDTRARKPITEHLAPISSKLAASWGTERPILVDVPYIDRGTTLPDGSHPASIVFDGAIENDVKIVPVVALDSDATYIDAAIAAAQAAGGGLALRIADGDLRDLKSLDYAMRTLLTKSGLKREAVDVIVDGREIAVENVVTRAAGLRTIIASFPARSAWRSMTILSGAFPSSLATLRGNSIRRVRRADWELWRTITTEGVGRPVQFGDYGIDNPVPFDPENPKTIQVSASVRYTSAEVWVVVKGKSTKVNGWEQTARLCEVLTECPEFMGGSFSSGDAYIEKRARNAVTCGNPTVWRRVGLSHHLAFVTDQLAMYGAP